MSSSSFKKRLPGVKSRVHTDATDVHDKAASSSAIPPGVRVSPYNSTLLLSTGIASLDDVLGGGVPTGSILLIEEDTDTSYAKLLLRYWVAQGLASKQNVSIISSGLDALPQAILAKLPFAEDDTDDVHPPTPFPGAIIAAPADEPLGDDTDEDVQTNAAAAATSTSSSAHPSMKIAFRYEGMQKYETSVANVNALLSAASDAPYCSKFDLTKIMSTASEAKQNRLHLCDVLELPGNPYEIALTRIKQTLRISPGASRIAVQSIASLAWKAFDQISVYRFLLELKHTLREHTLGRPAAAVVTIPAAMLRNIRDGQTFVHRFEWACDSVIEIESFAASPSLAAVFPTYSGLLHIRRLPTPNCLLPPSAKLSMLRGLGTGSNSTSSGAGGMENNLGFKLKRRRGLVIETLHLDEGLTGDLKAQSQAANPVENEQVLPRTEGTAAAIDDLQVSVQPSSASAAAASGSKKLQRRTLRFDNADIGASKATSTQLQSGFDTKHPERYEF